MFEHKTLTCYEDLLRHVLMHGVWEPTRPGIRALAHPALTFHIRLCNQDLKGRYYFPLITNKKVFFNSVVAEFLWMWNGHTNIKFLQGTSIWDEWADENGDLGPIYGHQYRHWGEEEYSSQISQLMKGLKHNPYGRRHIVSAWNVGELPEMRLPPCHLLFQVVRSPGKSDTPLEFLSHKEQSKHQNGDIKPKDLISLIVYQRSWDLFLGAPHNIAYYALIAHLIAAELDCVPYGLTFNIGNAHIYENHIEQTYQCLSRVKIPDFPSIQIYTTPCLESMTWGYYTRAERNSMTLSDFHVTSDPKIEEKDIFLSEHTSLQRQDSHVIQEKYTDGKWEIIPSPKVVIYNYNPLPYIKAPIAI
jgi:thymidylate synthase